MATWIALLRGINVGTRRRLPMKDLSAIFSEAGAAPVRTWIQSGNVVFGADDAEAVRVVVEAGIEARFGFHSAIVLRSAQALAAIAADNPFVGDEPDTSRLHVAFLRDAIDPDVLSPVPPGATERVAVREGGREIYLHTPDGLGRTRLPSAAFEPRGTVSTLRNWRTTLKLLELAGG